METGKSGGERSELMEGQSPLLAAIKREVEALEDKLLARILRLEQQHLNFDAVLENVARADTKLQDVEARQRQSEVTLAQLSGLVKGAMDELQSVQRSMGTPRGTPRAPQGNEVPGGSFGTTGVEHKLSMLKAAEVTLPLVQDQVARMSEKIEAHSDALAQVRKVLEIQLQQQQQQSKELHLQEAKPGVSRPKSLQDEMSSLTECIASAEGAILHLAPKLLKAAAEAKARQEELMSAAQSLQAAVGQNAE